MSFCILACVYYHNIPTSTPHSGFHGVTKIAKNADIAKLAENYMNCISARPTLPTQTLWSHLFQHAPPPPPRKKADFKWEGSQVVVTKNSLGDAFIRQNNDFTRV